MKQELLIAYFRSLAPVKQEQLISQLMDLVGVDESTVESSRAAELSKGGISCPGCLGKRIVGYGKYKQVQRYKCTGCGKTFNSMSGSAVHGLHKRELLKPYLYLMLQGCSLREIAGRMDICLKTAFDWRHKILKGLCPSDINLTGVVEADETFFLHSAKGSKKEGKPRKRGGKSATQGVSNDLVAVVTAYERKSGKSVNTVACLGRITKVAIENGVGKWLDKGGSILCTDSHKSFEGFAIDNGIAHKRIFVRRHEHVVEGIYHIQHVNRIHGKLKRWIARFNGVATKYLQNYLNYFALVNRLSGCVNQAEKALQYILQQNRVFVPRNQICQQQCIT